MLGSDEEDEDLFSWEEYLKKCHAKAVPKESFKHVSTWYYVLKRIHRDEGGEVPERPVEPWTAAMRNLDNPESGIHPGAATLLTSGT